MAPSRISNRPVQAGSAKLAAGSGKSTRDVVTAIVDKPTKK